MAKAKKKTWKLPPLDSPELAHISPDLRAIAVPIDSLIPDPGNVMLHPQRNFEATKASLATYGQRKSIVVNERTGIVEAGNGTLDAGKALGWKWIARSRENDDQITATGYSIADNRTAKLAEWDEPALAIQLEALQGDGIELEFLGFTELELEEMKGGEGSGEGSGEDPGAGDPPENPVSKEGEIYELGPHRLICGDSTDPEVVDLLLGGETPRLMVTDPPYGVEYDANWRNEAADAGLIGHGASRVGKVKNDDRADWREAWELFPGDVAYVYHAGTRSPEVAESLVGVGFLLRCLIVWAKPRFAISRGHYHHQHEPCWYAFRKGKTAGWIGDRSQTTLWEIGLDKNLEGEVKHSTQKPLECMERPIRHHEGDVYEPFCGSGTTLIAAQRQGRKCYAIELDPAYCDVIRKRWGDYARANDVEPGPDAL